MTLPFAHFAQEKWHGFQSNFAFSNWFEILWARAFHRRRSVVLYEWKSRYLLACDVRHMDHYSPKELLAGGAYHPFIEHSLHANACAYVNVGANIGAFDVAVALLATTIPHALSVELNPSTFHRLTFNLDANDLRDVIPMNCGVAGAAGTIRFASSACSLADSIWNANDGSGEEKSVEVALKTLDACLAEAGVAEVEFDLLKLDCEGAEYGIVRQSSRATLRRFRFMVMELHRCPPEESVEAFHRKLDECGFKALRLPKVRFASANLSFWERV